MIKLILILLLIGLSCRSDVDGSEKLEANVLELIQGFNGDVGIYVRHLFSNTTVGVNENKIIVINPGVEAVSEISEKDIVKAEKIFSGNWLFKK